MRYQVQTGTGRADAATSATRAARRQRSDRGRRGRVDMTIEGSKMKATGGSAPVRRSCSRRKPEAEGRARTPGIMQQDRPVNGKSRRARVLRAARRRPPEFTGRCELWQGDNGDIIQGDKITVDGKTGNLSLRARCFRRWSCRIRNPTTTTSARRRGRTGQGPAHDLRRRGAEGHLYDARPRLVGPQGDLTAETIVLTLGSERPGCRAAGGDWAMSRSRRRIGSPSAIS